MLHIDSYQTRSGTFLLELLLLSKYSIEMTWLLSCFSCKRRNKSKGHIKEQKRSAETVLKTKHSRLQQETSACQQLLRSENQEQNLHRSNKGPERENICLEVATSDDRLETPNLSRQIRNYLSNLSNYQVEDDRTHDQLCRINGNTPDHDDSGVNFIPEYSLLADHVLYENAGEDKLLMVKDSVTDTSSLACNVLGQTLSKQRVVSLDLSQSKDSGADVNATELIESYASLSKCDDAIEGHNIEKTSNHDDGVSSHIRDDLPDPKLFLTKFDNVIEGQYDSETETDDSCVSDPTRDDAQYLEKAEEASYSEESCLSDPTRDDAQDLEKSEEASYSEESSLNASMIKQETGLPIRLDCKQVIEGETSSTESPAEGIYELGSQSPSKSVEFEDRHMQAGSDSKSCMDVSSVFTSEMLSPSSAHSNVSRLSCSSSSTCTSKVETPKSVQSSLSREDRPILAAASVHQISKPSTQKGWDEKGIPNSTNKYKEDQKVSWHATPFEVRLERALAKQRPSFPKRLFMEL